MRYDNAKIGFDRYDGKLEAAFKSIEGHTIKDVGFVVLCGVWCFTIDSQIGIKYPTRSVFPFYYGMSVYPATKTVMSENIVLYDDKHDRKLNDAFRSLSGQVIMNMGFLKIGGVDHLVIDSDDNRLVIGFCDLGMSIRWQGKFGVQTARDKLLSDIDDYLNRSKGCPYLEEDVKALKYSVVDYVSGAKIDIGVHQLKMLEDCDGVRAEFSKIEKDPETILNTLDELYEAAWW